MENSKPTVGEGISPAVGLYFVCFEKQMEILLIAKAIFITFTLLKKQRKTAGLPSCRAALTFRLATKVSKSTRRGARELGSG